MSLLASLGAHLQAFLAVDTIRSLAVDDVAFLLERRLQGEIAVAGISFGQDLQSLAQIHIIPALETYQATERGRPPDGRPTADSSSDRWGGSRPLAAGRAAPFSLDQLLESRLIQFRFGQQPRQPGVLVLEITQPLGVG